MNSYREIVDNVASFAGERYCKPISKGRQAAYRLGVPRASWGSVAGYSARSAAWGCVAGYSAGGAASINAFQSGVWTPARCFRKKSYCRLKP
jgi:hypothetical protein